MSKGKISQEFPRLLYGVTGGLKAKFSTNYRAILMRSPEVKGDLRTLEGNIAKTLYTWYRLTLNSQKTGQGLSEKISTFSLAMNQTAMWLSKVDVELVFGPLLVLSTRQLSYSKTL